ncbi:MAG: GNAT family N-acetyltransferase [Cyanobacteria bacterium J06627_28]
MNIHFILATLAELETLMEYMEAFHDFDHTEPFDRLRAQAAMEKVVADKSVGRVWLIQQNDQTVGYMVLTLGYRLEYRGYYAFLDELYIREDRRGQGIGAKALEFLSQACKTLDVLCLQLEVKQDNLAAKTFYERSGFVAQTRAVFLKPIL